MRDGILEENLEGGGEMRITLGVTRTWLAEDIILKKVKYRAREYDIWEGEIRVTD